jgi:nucleoside phosphorylase
LKSVLQLPGNWQEARFYNDGTLYYTGSFSSATKSLKVVAASTHQMGIPATAVLSMKLILHFRPHYLIMTGIAAGVKTSGGNLGDIIIADQSWDYQSGKNIMQNGEINFYPDPRSIPLNTEIKEQFLHLSASREYLNEIQKGWKDTIPYNLNLIVGPVASGELVVQNSDFVKELLLRNRKLVGIDMETYGIFYTAENCINPKPIAISIKSISDFADDKKSDEYHSYAAYTSSKYMYNFALNNLKSISI